MVLYHKLRMEKGKDEENEKLKIKNEKLEVSDE
jgi:hypothetical protein